MLHSFPELLILAAVAGISAAIASAIERRKARARLRELEATLESRIQELDTLMDVLPIGIGIASDPACRHIRTNRAFAEMLDIDPRRNASLSAPPEEAPANFKVLHEGRELLPEELPIQRAASEGVLVRDFEEVVVRSDGRHIDLLSHAAPIFDQDRACRGAVGVFVDITERKCAEEALKASLIEKQVLLQEINHRVKNNLQFIVSLLRLQGAESQNSELKDVLEETRRRVHAMALVHEKLYRAEDFAKIDYASYLRELVAALARTTSEAVAHVEFAVEADAVGLETAAAVPIGLVVTELVSNSLKHAFADGRAGRIAVAVHGDPERGYDLTVRDNGVGTPGGFDPATSRSMGWRLVEMLVRQLDGTIRMSRDGGTEFAVHFMPRKHA